MLAIGELLTPGLFFLGPVALAAAAAAVAVAARRRRGDLGARLPRRIGRIARRAAADRAPPPQLPALSRTGTDALVGRKATVTRRVDAAGGRVRIGGEEWSARSYLDDEVYAEGATVDVVRIEGATALVAE